MVVEESPVRLVIPARARYLRLARLTAAGIAGDLGFGLEAVKGSLFASLEPADLPHLRRLRSLCAYCPNRLADQRRRTLLIMMRSLRT